MTPSYPGSRSSGEIVHTCLVSNEPFVETDGSPQSNELLLLLRHPGQLSLRIETYLKREKSSSMISNY